jgi:hypothetical protein
MAFKLSRRQLLQAATATAGAAALGVGTTAAAQTANNSALLVIFMNGGWNALFGGAGPMITYGHFGVTASNVRDLGNGLIVDGASLGALPSLATTRMATIGVYHRFSGHDSAPRAQFSNGSRSYPLMLASAMGGTAAIRCAVVGNRYPAGPRPEENGVSMQMITDMSATIAGMGGTTTDTTVPNRATAAQALMAARSMAQQPLADSPTSLKTVREAYDSSIAMLSAPPQGFDYTALASAYGVSANTTSVNSFTTQMLAAELMIRSGTKVVLAVRTGDWDTHSDNPATGERDRASMAPLIAPLTTFLNRMMAGTSGFNVTTAIIGDFARSLPSSDHANFTSATVIGPRVRTGSTGTPIVTRGTSFNTDAGVRYNDRLSIDTNTPGVPGFWSYLATVMSAPTNPFGTNPHNLVL